MRLPQIGECDLPPVGFFRRAKGGAASSGFFRRLENLFFCILSCLVVTTSAQARQIEWYSDIFNTNLTSDGALMDGTFVFELGVFAGTFVPTNANTADWKTHWRPAPGQRQAYNTALKNYSGIMFVEDDYPDFSTGKATYIWGFNAHGDGKEWILFRRTTWTWPEPDPFNPVPLVWQADEATQIIVGSINASGTPHLMRTARIENSELPPTTWSEWQAIALAGESENAPGDDPDKDGCTNLLEFVFGTNPLIPGPPVKPTFDLMALAPDQFARLTIPRRRDRLANLWVEVSVDLQNWSTNGDPGGPFTTTVSDTAASWVVRDLTPVRTGQPKRFLRMAASLP